MKILSKLTANAAADGPDRPRKGIRQGHDYQLGPGQYLRYNVTHAGLFLETGVHQVIIPLEELQALASAHNAAFAAKPKHA